jgi:hypothetical protein
MLSMTKRPMNVALILAIAWLLACSSEADHSTSGAGGGAQAAGGSVSPATGGSSSGTDRDGSAGTPIANDATVDAPLDTTIVVDEFFGPFPSWADAKRDDGAVGDGKADDTASLQKALDALGADGKPNVLFLPAGTYRITGTLKLTQKLGVAFFGADPTTTKIAWDGAGSGPMFILDGVTTSRFGRITWDGAGKAEMGVAHWWNHTRGPYAPTALEHADEVFTNLGKGLVGGRMDNASYGWNDAEVLIVRNQFSHCSQAGVSIESFNALDYWIWDSQFTDSARGVTNELGEGGGTGAGNFSVYRSTFERSSIADATLCNTGFFSFRGNVSVGSKRFLQACNIGANSAQLTFQKNRIATTDPVAIDVGNTGPVMLIDNEILSPMGAIGPVVRLSGSVPGDLLTIGNKYTVASPIANNTSSPRTVAIEDQTVAASSIAASVPDFVGFAPARKHMVFEVQAGAGAAGIQAAIDMAVASGDDLPVVHLPEGDYAVNASIKVPAAHAIAIVGDHDHSVVRWTGSTMDPLLELAGPSRALVEGLNLQGAGKAATVAVLGADQAGGRVFIDGVLHDNNKQANLIADGLRQTHIEARAYEPGMNAGVGLQISGGTSMIMRGGGTFGDANTTMYQVTSGGNLVVEDVWFEGGGNHLFRGDSGNFTYTSSFAAPGDQNHGGGAADASILVSGFSGQVTLLGASFNLPVASNGILVEKETAQTSALVFGVEANKHDYFQHTSTGGMVGLELSREYIPNQGSMPIADSGAKGSDFVRTGLTQLRQLDFTDLHHAPAGATDVRLRRLTVQDPSVGISIRP